MGDGDGWVRCSLGHKHWGRFGAAGLLLTSGGSVLLQHRAAWTHEGDTWALPGGARDSYEQARDAALRETVEETSLAVEHVTPFGEWVDEHGGWSYTTVLAHAAETLVEQQIAPANGECTQVCWWPIDDVSGLALHHGFAAAWPTLRGLIVGVPR